MSTQVEVVEMVGRMPYASNATMLGRDDEDNLWVYKPDQGESPLWDFPPRTLARREIMTFEVCTAMGLDIIPPTFEADGVYGVGSAQRFIDEDSDFDPRQWFEGELEPTLWPFAVLDIVTNNADRKVGHLIKETNTDRIWGIDNGLTFHPLDKLRTVLWGFAGQRLPDHLVDGVASLSTALEGDLRDRMCSMLGESEADVLSYRTNRLLESPIHPLPPTDRPAVPWPMW